MGLFRNRDWNYHGFNKKTKSMYDEAGYDREGYDGEGFNENGFNKDGFDADGCIQFQLTSTFSKITSTYDSDFAAVIAMTYDEPTKMKSKLFFSNDEKMGIYSKDFESFSNNNVVHIRIEKAGKHSNAKWIKPKDTGKTQGDNLEPGYTLIVNFNKNDPSLKHFVIGKLAELKFGSLPSAYTFHCHRDEDYPTDERAKELLQEVVELFNC